jgi:hypothetical protein
VGATLNGLRGFLLVFLRVLFYHESVYGASQAAEICVIIRWSGAEVDAQRGLVLRAGPRDVDVDGVVAEQQAVYSVPNLLRETEEAEATLALRSVGVLV